MGIEKTEDGKKWRLLSHGYRIGSAQNLAGGWVNGKKSGGSILEPREPEFWFQFPSCGPPNSDIPVLQLREVFFSYEQDQGLTLLYYYFSLTFPSYESILEEVV